jgi:serine/threonine protein kinase
VDIRADIYSLGATMYCLLAGHPMFPEGRTAQKLMWQQLREPTPIQELRKDVPPKLAAILHKALAKNPGARQQTPWELEQELAEFALGTSPAPEPHLLPSPPPRWNGGISHNGTNFQQVSMNASCAVIELPEYRPEFLKTTLSDLEQSTQTRILPTTRTPLIQPFAIRSSTSLYEQPLAPGTFQMQLRTAAMAGLSLFIAGLATGLGIFWLIRG